MATTTKALQNAIIDQLTRHLSGRRVVVLTGAGISTDSGIPDYRGPVSRLRTRNPVTYHEFMRSHEDRQRYWARSYVGWPFMQSRFPNASHRALTALQRSGQIGPIITQNVDGLHHAAGSSRVLELHGGLARVVCTVCGARTARKHMQQLMAHHNPSLTVAPAEYAPDGDAELDRSATRSFVVPPCESCGGILKPDVVFFGESVPRERVETAFSWLAEHEVLLVLGSSLTVYSGYRFADRIVRDGGELVIVNNGETRADAIAHLKIDVKLGDVLPALTERMAAIAS